MRFYKVLLCFCLLLSFSAFAQPPACTTTFLAGVGTHIVNAGQTACIPSGSSFTGSLVVRAGGHVVVCNGTFTGALTIDPAFGATPAGTLWTIGTQNFTGAVANNGTTNTAAGNCGAVACPDTSLNNSPSAVCSGATTIDLSAIKQAGTAAGTWSITSAPGGSTATLSGADNATFNINSTVAGSYTIRHTLAAPGAAPCGQFAERTVTINALPTPTLTLGVDAACIDAAAFNLTGGLPAASAGPPATTGIYSGSGVGVSPSFDPSAAGGAGVKVITYTYTDGNGCVGTATDNFTVNALPTPTLTLGVDAACIDAAAFNLTGGLPAASAGPPATTGIYSGSGVGVSPSFDPSAAGGAGVKVITYTYTDGNGCVGTATDNFTVNALPTPTLTLGVDAACIDAAAFNLTGGLPAASAGPPATTGIYSGSGVGVSPSFDPSAAGGAGVKVITYTYTDGNGCVGTATDNFTVNALPTPTLTLGVDAACIDAGLIALTGGSPAGGAGPPVTTGVYSGTGVTGTNIDPTVVGAGNSSTVTYTYTDGNGCVGTATDVFTVNALPTPTLTLGTDAACIDAGLIALTGGSPAGSAGPPVTTGVYSGTGVTGTNIDPAIVGAGNTSTVTYTYTDGNGCVGTATDVFTVNALPTPTLTLGTDAACVDAGLIVLTGGSPAGSAGPPVTTGVYSGTGVTGTNIDPTVVGAGNTSTVTYTYTDGNGCVGTATDVFTVNALPTPTLTLGTDAACIDAGLIVLTGGSPAGSAGPPVTTGVYSGTGVTGTNIDPTVVGAGNTSTITYTYTDGNGCVGTATDVFTVNALPTPTLTLGTDAACVDAGLIALTGGSPAGSAGPPVTTGVYSGTGVIGTNIDPTVVGAGNTSTVTYTYTDGNGCVGTATDVFTVNALPSVVFVLRDDEMCVDEAAVAVSGGLPLGGVYSGNGITTSPTFDPAVSGVGVFELTYTFMDGNGCVDSATDSMTVFGLPSVAFVLRDDEMCIDAGMLALSGGVPTGGIYSGNGLTTSPNFNPLQAGAGKFEIVYTYTDANGCVNFATDSLIVNALPIVSVAKPSAVCIDANVFTFTGGLPLGGTFTGNGVSSANVFDPVIAGAGTHSIVYSFKDGNGCIDTAMTSMLVNALPVVNLPQIDPICVNELPIQWTTGTPSGGVYSGLGIINKFFDPTTAGVGDHEITYTFTDGNNCVNMAKSNVRVNAKPIVDLGPDRTVCLFLDAKLEVPEQGAQYSWNTGASTRAVLTNQPGTYFVEVIDTNNCLHNDTIVLTPGPMLNVDLGTDLKVCEGEDVEFSVPVFNDITWSDGSKGTSVVISKSDTIDVLVIDAAGCYARDTAKTELVPKATVISLRDDTTICTKANDVVALEVSNSGVSVSWQDGTTGPTYDAVYSGEYIVTITDVDGCTASDTVYLKDSCSTIGLTMPTIFTPNYNNFNDNFCPIEMEWSDKDFIYANIGYIRFQVFDRWGVLMHASEGVIPRWNGKSAKGLPCSDGTYFWKLEYSDASGVDYNKSGFIKLYRP